MIRLAVFDIDRTLIPPGQGAVAPETARALKQLQEKGIRIAIASGRLFPFLPQDLKDLGFDYYIMSNGACIADKNGAVITQETMDPEILESLIREMLRRNLPIDIRYCHGRRSGNPECTVVERMQGFWRERNVHVTPPKAMTQEYTPLPGEQPTSCGAYIPPEEQPEMMRLFPQLAFLPVFEGPMCDISPAGVSKASGMIQVCRLSGIDISETIAFGDDRNDLELIQTAHIGVAMGDAIPAVMEAATYITGTSEALGVVTGLRHFGLLD